VAGPSVGRCRAAGRYPFCYPLILCTSRTIQPGEVVGISSENLASPATRVQALPLSNHQGPLREAAAGWP